MDLFKCMTAPHVEFGEGMRFPWEEMIFIKTPLYAPIPPSL